MIRKFKAGDKVRITATVEEMQAVGILRRDAVRFAERGEHVISHVGTDESDSLPFGVLLEDNSIPWFLSEDMLELAEEEASEESGDPALEGLSEFAKYVAHFHAELRKAGMSTDLADRATLSFISGTTAAAQAEAALRFMLARQEEES